MNTNTTNTNICDICDICDILCSFHTPKVDLGNGDFEYMKDKYSRDLCINAFHAITLCEAWDFMAQDCESYTYSDSPYIYKIMSKMETSPPYGPGDGGPGHTGASFGIVMREMQFLAKYGVEAHKLRYMDREPTVPL